MARLFAPVDIRFSVVSRPGVGLSVAGIVVSGGLYLFGPESPRLDGQIELDADEQAAILSVVQAAATRHWQALAAQYAATVDEPGATDVDVPALAESA